MENIQSGNSCDYKEEDLTCFFHEGSLDSFSHLDYFHDWIKTLFLFRIYLTVCGES